MLPSIYTVVVAAAAVVVVIVVRAHTVVLRIVGNRFGAFRFVLATRASAGPVWYQLRGLPLVGSDCVCPQCSSSLVITRGSAMPSAMTFLFVSRDLKSSQETPIVTTELPDKN